MIKTAGKWLAIGAVLGTPVASFALDQWATKLIDFSSQYGTTSYSAKQALKAPDTATYGDLSTAWTPSSANGTAEYITVAYTTPVYATGAMIRETYGWGFVTRIDAIDLNGVARKVWSGTDTSLPSQINEFSVSWAKTTYLVNSLKVYTSTDATSSWEEIDAIQLRGVQPLSGTVAPLLGHTATLTCTNTTTAQTVTATITGPGSAGKLTQWDCEAAGLKVKSGQRVTMQIEGKYTP